MHLTRHAREIVPVLHALAQRCHPRSYPGQLYPNGSRMLDVKMGFQPEIGSVCAPPMDSLARFFSQNALAAFPVFNASYDGIHPAWRAHAYESFVDADHTDRVYAHGPIPTTEDWVAAATLVTFRQYQAMFEGYTAASWTRYSAIIKWKTQSPWPGLRGCLYDSYLAVNGAFWGVRAGTGASDDPLTRLHVQMRQGDGAILVVSARSLGHVEGPLYATAYTYDVSTGLSLVLPLTQQVAAPGGSIAPGAVVVLPLHVSWPNASQPGTVVLWRLVLTTMPPDPGALPPVSPLSRSEYWLSNLDADTPTRRPQNYTALAALRRNPNLAVKIAVNVTNVTLAPNGRLRFVVALTSPAGAPSLALGVEICLRDAAASVRAATGFVDDRVLPSDVSDGVFSIVPGETHEVVVSADAPSTGPQSLVALGPHGAVAGWGMPYIRMTGWNVAAVDVPVQLPSKVAEL